ncbi:MAG: hypothetical protein OEZ28_12265, partial [Nitrospinota bacterium]|nr:hypothetical protein [Nitrospinota bacterium]
MIELLVSMIIASFLVVGMVQMFRSNRLALNLVDDVRVMEQNARVGVDFMSRDFRKAGMGAHQAIPFMPVDNADTAKWSSANTGFTAKGHPVLPGTDITEMFWGYLPIPVCVMVDSPGATGFNTNNANLKIPRISLMGLPDYSMTLDGDEVKDLLDQFNVLVYDPGCPDSVNCQQNLTDAASGWNNAGGDLTVQLGYNRGNNQDDANRPHDCKDFEIPPGSISPDPKCPSGVACVNIGEDMYYFVQQVEADNPQLVRYKAGAEDAAGNSIYEVMSNYVEDFQFEYGV